MIPQKPTAIFEGLRSEEDEDRWGYGWRCYCGIPEQSFRPDGSSARSYPGQVYLVFVNDEKVETVAALLGQTSTWQGDSQGKRPDSPSES